MVLVAIQNFKQRIETIDLNDWLVKEQAYNNMIKTKTSRYLHFTEQIIEVTYTNQNKEGNETSQQLTIHFTQDQFRIIKIKYEHANQIKLMNDTALKDMIMRVVELNIQWHNIGNKGCKLVSNIYLPKLKVLNLGGNKITAKGVFHLSKIPAKLSLVYLSNNLIGKQGLFWLSKLPSSLRLLNIQGNNIKNQDLTPLLLGQSDRMSQLIFRTINITKDTLERLKSKYSSAQFYY